MAATSSVARILPNTVGLAFRHLADGVDFGRGQGLSQPLDDGADLLRRTRSRDLNRRIRHLGPRGKVGKGHVDPAIFGRARPQSAHRIQSNGCDPES